MTVAEFMNLFTMYLGFFSSSMQDLCLYYSVLMSQKGLSFSRRNYKHNFVLAVFIIQHDIVKLNLFNGRY